MTTPQLLQQARQGDSEAIAQLMNDSLNPKGIEATVLRQGDRLNVLLTSANVVNQTVLTQFVQNGIQNLNIPDIKTVELVGQTQSDPDQTWSQVFSLNSGPSSAPSAPPQPPPPPSNTVLPPPVIPQPAAAPVTQPPLAESPLAESPLAENPPEPSLPLSDERDEIMDTFVDDLSLDDELSIDTIDQIVADAVEEVRTKIQSEIPFDSEDIAIDAVDYSSGTDSSFDFDETDSAAVLGDAAGVSALDSALEQAIQTGQLDDLLEVDLDLTEPMIEDEIDQVDPRVDQTEPLPLPDLRLPSQSPELPDFNAIAADVDPSTEADLNITSGVGNMADEPIASATSAAPLAFTPVESTLSEPVPLDAMEPSEPQRLILDDLDLPETSEDGDRTNMSHGGGDSEDQSSSTDDKPASPILWAIVSALTFGSIAGLVGYSIQSYEGDWYQVVVGARDAESAEANADSSGADSGGADASEADASEADASEADASASGDASDTGTSDGGEDTTALADSSTTEATNPESSEADNDGEGAIAPDSPDNPDEATSETAGDEFPTTPPDEEGTTTEGSAGADPNATPTAGDGPEDTADTPGANSATATLQPPDGAIANCPAVATSPTQTLTLSQIQIDPEIAPTSGIYTIVGCLTNHTEGTIVAATLDYEGRLSADAAAKGSMYFDAPAPKTTVPFRTRLTLPDTASAIQVKGVIWNLEGEAAQTLLLEFSLPLASN